MSSDMDQYRYGGISVRQPARRRGTRQAEAKSVGDEVAVEVSEAPVFNSGTRLRNNAIVDDRVSTAPRCEFGWLDHQVAALISRVDAWREGCSRFQAETAGEPTKDDKRPGASSMVGDVLSGGPAQQNPAAERRGPLAPEGFSDQLRGSSRN